MKPYRSELKQCSLPLGSRRDTVPQNTSTKLLACQ